jgi:hypothetical protein
VPIFRSGKPKLLASLASDVVVAAGNIVPPWDVVEDDPTGYYSAGVWTVERDGLYVISAGLRKAASATAVGPVVRIVVDGLAESSNVCPAGTGVLAVSTTRVMELSAGSTVYCNGIVAAGAGGTLTAQASYFSLARIGPVRWT